MILLLFLLLSLSEAASVPDEVKHATVGGNIILKCEAADSSIIAVEWTRSDLGSREYVLLYRNGRLITTYQQPSFKGRVHLIESEVKKGDLSLSLANVSSSDQGTYECRAVFGGSRRNKRALIPERPIRTIKLQVSDSGPESNSQAGDEPETPPIGSRGRAAAVMAVGFVLSCSAAIALFLFQKRKRQADSQSKAAADEPEAKELA